MPIPSGEHEIVFKFEPKSHATGWTLTSFASILAILLFVIAAFFEWKQRKVTVK